MESKRKQSVLLVVPPVNLESMDIWSSSNFLSSLKCLPTLGLGYIAAVLEQHEFPVKILDMYALGHSISDFKEFIIKENPDVIGITCDTETYLQVKFLAKIARKILPRCKIIVGGIHPTIFPEETISSGLFDAAVLGEGEYTMLELVEHYQNDQDIADVKHIVFLKDNEVHQTGSGFIVEDLDKIPFPARHLMPNEKYSTVLSRHDTMTTMIISRGCPFNCLYCICPGRWRGRSPRNVVDEIEELINVYKIKEIMFMDSTFSVNKKQVTSICKEIVKRNLEITWSCSTRVDCVDLELLSWMKRAGCERIQLGIESSNQQVLDNIRKNITLEQVENAIEWARKVRMETFLFFIIGAPGDTIQIIEETIQYAIDLDPDYVSFLIATPYPGTDMFELAVKHKQVPANLWKDFASGKTRHIPRPVMETREYDRKLLLRLLRKANRKFYLRPRYFIKTLLKIRSIARLKNNINGFKSVIFEMFSIH